jgi:DNA-binding response OmpR family regulator
MEKRILIVDDEPDICATLFDVLTSAGYRVQTASDGREAVCKANEFRPHLTILDIGLPDGNGLLLSRTLGILHETPVIILTGLPSFDLEEPLSANPYVKSILFKPCSPRTLLSAVEEVLGPQPSPQIV